MEEKTADKLRKAGLDVDRRSMPKHVALTVSGHKLWAQKHRKPIEKVYEDIFPRITSVVECQVKFDIPILTVYMLTGKIKESLYFSVLMDALVTFFEELAVDPVIRDNRVKVSILGKWYNLPGRVIDPIKKVLDETKDYDAFFLNLCINYDGQEEIADACKLIAMKVNAGKIDPDAVTVSEIRENIYSSYFLPPDFLIKTGVDKRLGSFMLWDSIDASVYFSDVLWLDFKEPDFIKALKYYQENR